MIIYLELWGEMSPLKLGWLNSCQTNAFNISHKEIKMFPLTKHRIHESHKFTLVVVNDYGAWLSSLTSGPQELGSCLGPGDGVLIHL